MKFGGKKQVEKKKKVEGLDSVTVHFVSEHQYLPPQYMSTAHSVNIEALREAGYVKDENGGWAWKEKV